MKELKFKCRLLSDVIINQKASSEGPNTTLDYIPGSNFLGIAAADIYLDDNISECDKWEIFHSGKVRFGDAHPSCGTLRSHKIPASIFYPKLSSVYQEAYVHHRIKDFTDSDLKKKQLKQCRAGFFTFTNDKACKIETESTFAIKSARDRDLRKSKDSEIFGYQSLRSGLEMLFSVEIENDNLVDLVKNALVGRKKVGRSRSAQYGQIEISSFDFADDGFDDTPADIVTIYADSRLIFLDEEGFPTFQPSIEQLGLPHGQILWDKSQIRTFCHAPYNYKRRCFDTDRCGIENGSVFVVKLDSALQKNSTAYIGSYVNEGYGKVLYNPVFLKADAEGKSVMDFHTHDNIQETDIAEVPDSPLVNYLLSRKTLSETLENVYPMTNNWVRNNKNRFKDAAFASQWGSIRSIAMNYVGKEELKNNVKAYLYHGVASEKWKEHGRLNALEKFIDALTDENARVAIVNLSAEMGKICRKEA